MDAEREIGDSPLRRPGGQQVIPRPESWRPGDLPVWHGRDLSVLDRHDDITERLSVRLSELSAHGERPQSSVAGGDDTWERTARPSAVLVGLLRSHETPSVLLTRRAGHLRHHRGEVSFPGGRMEHGEAPVHTALREAHEEVALPHSAVTPLGELGSLSTFVSNSLITPVVATIDGHHQWAADPGEVARIFSVPLRELVRTDTYRNEWWETPRGEINIHFFELDDETIWGATARVLVHLLDLVTLP